MLGDRLTGEPSTGHWWTLASLQRPQRGHSPSVSVGETGTASAALPAMRRRNRNVRERTAIWRHIVVPRPSRSSRLVRPAKLTDHPWAAIELSDFGGKRGPSADTSNRHPPEHRWS